MLYMTKQILLLRLDMLAKEEREYVAGMKGMDQIRPDSLLRKLDTAALADMQKRRAALREEIKDIDAKIAESRNPPWNTWEERVEYYMKMYEFPESYRSDVEECLRMQDRYDFQDIEAFGHLLERKIDEEIDDE